VRRLKGGSNGNLSRLDSFKRSKGREVSGYSAARLPGQGTTFVVSLPLARSSEDEVPTDELRQIGPSGPPHT